MAGIPAAASLPVEWQMLTTAMMPRAHIDEIQPLLPLQSKPLDKNGNGNQNCYLASTSNGVGNLLLGLMSSEDALRVTEAAAELREDLEGDGEEMETHSTSIAETEKKQLINARKGQGKYRRNVEAVERGCRLTGVTDRTFLVASHIKPWPKSSNAERLNGNNDLLLSLHADRLFDRGWISFQDNGDIVCVNDIAPEVMQTWELDPSANIGAFNNQQKAYLAYQWEHVYIGRNGA